MVISIKEISFIGRGEVLWQWYGRGKGRRVEESGTSESLVMIERNLGIASKQYCEEHHA